MAQQPPVGQGLLIIEDSRSHSDSPLDEWSARHRDLYLTTHNTHKRHTSMPSAVFEPTIPESERPQTHAIDRAATGIGHLRLLQAKSPSVLGSSWCLNLSAIEGLVYTIRYQLPTQQDGFGGLVVSILATGTRVRGFRPVGFFRRPENPQYAFLRRGSKILCPMSQLCGM